MKTPAAPADPTNRGGTLPIDHDRSQILDPQHQSTSDRFLQIPVPLGVHPLGCPHLPNQINQHHFQAHCTAAFCTVPPNRIFSSGLNLHPRHSLSSLCLCGFVCASPQMLTFPSQVPDLTFLTLRFYAQARLSNLETTKKPASLPSRSALPFSGLFRAQGLQKLPSTRVTGGHALEREFCDE